MAPTFADHLIESGHNFDPSNDFLPLHSGINSYHKTIALENFEIIRHMKLNDIILLNRVTPDDGFLYKLHNANISHST